MKKIIYKVTHKKTGAVYIGTTQDLDKRRRDHIQKAKSGKGFRFQEAIAIYGPDAFEWEQIDSATSPNEAAEKEREYVIRYKSKEEGFNADNGGGLKKKIYQYNIDTGELLNIYENLADAGNAAGLDKKTISKACLGEIKTCAGFYWSYLLAENFKPEKDKCRKKVSQFTVKGEFIKTYSSVAEAAKQVDVNKSSIAKCCRGEYKSAGSFLWRYE